jgi:glycerol-3-phosphate acyltransferase PlsY
MPLVFMAQNTTTLVDPAPAVPLLADWSGGTWALAVLIAFLCGSLPTGYLIGKSRGIDIRKHGSGNIGATNVGRVLGPKAWVLCFGVDFLKGFTPVLVVGLLAGLASRWNLPPREMSLWLGVMVAPILGHMFCPWLRFKGGKGIATGLGAVLGIFPVLTIAGAAAFVVFVAALKAWKYVSLASLLAGCTLPLSLLALAGVRRLTNDGPLGESPWLLPSIVATALMAATVIVKHRGNIARIRAGTEPKVGARKQAT